MSGASDAKKITKYVNEIMRLMDRVTELKLAHENYKSMVRDRDERIAELEETIRERDETINWYINREEG